jgi:CubicO group peptidase (beta-lactamase class C family)
LAEADGIDPGRLDRLRTVLQGYCDRGEIPGAVALIQRNGCAPHCIAVGHGDDEADVAFGPRSIVRIGSMTKPLISVLALMMMEEGRFRLSDTVTTWLPELARMRVLTHPQAKLDDSMAAKRAITIEDLLTHRPGFGTALVAAGELGQAVQALSGGLGQRAQLVPDEWMSLLATLPLAAQPGETVINGFATDVLGVLLARVAGQALPELLRQRLLDPLGMDDTDFLVPAEKIDRLVPAYSVGWLSRKRLLIDHPSDSRFARMPAFPSGSGGLVSTAEDYLRFAQMMLAGGILDRTRLLSRKSVELMTTNFLTPDQRAMPFFGADFWSDRGLGLGVYIIDDLARHGRPASLGQFGWGGAFATTWFNDPSEQLIAILMLQVAFPAVTPEIRGDFEAMVYQSVTD